VLVIGVLVTTSAAVVARKDGSPGEITCGSDVMRPGDVCEETRRGVVTDTYTYEEAVQEKKAGAENYANGGRWIQLGIGIGLILIATLGIVLTKRRRARQPLTSAALHLQQQAAWQQQQVAQPVHTQQAPYPQQYQQPYPPQQRYQQQYPDFGPRG